MAVSPDNRFATNVLFDAQKRQDERIECSVSCRIGTASGEMDCRIVNASAGGVGLSISHLSKLKVGDRVRIVSGPLSGTAGLVRWGSSPRYGVELERSPANASALRNFIGNLRQP